MCFYQHSKKYTFCFLIPQLARVSRCFLLPSISVAITMLSILHKLFNKNIRSPSWCIMLESPEISFFEIIPMFSWCTRVCLYLENSSRFALSKSILILLLCFLSFAETPSFLWSRSIAQSPVRMQHATFSTISLSLW